MICSLIRLHFDEQCWQDWPIDPPYVPFLVLVSTQPEVGLVSHILKHLILRIRHIDDEWPIIHVLLVRIPELADKFSARVVEDVIVVLNRLLRPVGKGLLCLLVYVLALRQLGVLGVTSLNGGEAVLIALFAVAQGALVPRLVAISVILSVEQLFAFRLQGAAALTPIVLVCCFCLPLLVQMVQFQWPILMLEILSGVRACSGSIELSSKVLIHGCVICRAL